MATGVTGVTGVILFLIPVLIFAQINQEVDVSGVKVRTFRFTFGGIQRLSGILDAVCKEKCPQTPRYFGLHTAKMFCALNCPLNQNATGANNNVNNVGTMMPASPGGMMGNITMVINMPMPGMPGSEKPKGPEDTNPTNEDSVPPGKSPMSEGTADMKSPSMNVEPSGNSTDNMG